MPAKRLYAAPLFLICASYAPYRAPAPVAGVAPDMNALDNPSVRAAPQPDLNAWNATDDVRMKNNCYAHAANDIDTSEFGAMPGHRTLGQPFPKTDISYADYERMLIRGAIADGMIYTGNKPATRPGYYRVVLLMSPRYNNRSSYWHWLRQNNNGLWSGKDGSGEATDLDRFRRPITDPEKAWFGPYVQPVAYFLVPQGGLDVGNPKERKTHPGTRPALRYGA